MEFEYLSKDKNNQGDDLKRVISFEKNKNTASLAKERWHKIIKKTLEITRKSILRINDKRHSL